MLKIVKNILTISTLLFIIPACGGGGDGSGNRNIGPTITNTSPATINEGEEATLSVSATDSDGFIREIRWRQTAGPGVSFTNGTDSITFDAPEVDADTVLSFSVDAVDDFGAIASLDFNVTVLNIETTQAKLVVTQVSSVSSWFDHHWLTIKNTSDSPLELDKILLRISGYDLHTGVTTPYVIKPVKEQLQPGEERQINLEVLNVQWPFESALNVEVLSPDSVVPDWQANGYIEIYGQSEQLTYDLVHFGNNQYQPLNAVVGLTTRVQYEDYPMATIFQRAGNASEWYFIAP
jgi:hypothetical protein